MFDYTVTFATLNCLDFTKQFLQSLLASGLDSNRIVAVDNASSDGTPDFLKQQGLGGVILNKENLSCGAAWNQGILSHQSEWTIVMNNDVIVTPGFVEGLIGFATINNLKVVSPARIDGKLNYDFLQFAENAQNKTAKAVRFGSSNLICTCIHWSVFKKIGFFRANPTLLGFEDGIFYNDVRNNGISHATTGSVWIHHFGSVTQDHMKMVFEIQNNDVLVKVNDRKLYGQSWLQRKLFRHNLKRSHKAWRSQELCYYGMTLHGIRNENAFVWI